MLTRIDDNGDNIKPGWSVKKAVLSQVVLGGSAYLSLFLLGYCCGRGTASLARSGFHFNKYKHFTLLGDDIDFSIAAAKIPGQYSVAIFGEVFDGDMFSILSKVLPTIEHAP